MPTIIDDVIYTTDGHKHDGGKLRPSLFPMSAKRWMLRVLEFGARKYSMNGWKNVPNAKHRYTEALLRHVDAVSEGMNDYSDPFVLDEDSGLPHLAHVMCNAAFLLYFKDNEERKDT